MGARGMLTVVHMVCAAALVAGGELHARRWFNNPVFRLNDDRTVVLFFFEAGHAEAGGTGAPSLDRVVERLNRIHARRDHVVIGLTPDGCEAAQRFIQRYRVRFTVGCGSRSARSFAVERFPTLLVIDRRAGGAVEALEEQELERRAAEASNRISLAEWAALEEEELERRAAEVLAARANPADLLPDDPQELMEYIRGGWRQNAPGTAINPEIAVQKLFELVDRPTFDRFAAEQLPREPIPWVRSELRYLSSLPPDVTTVPEREGVAPSRMHEMEFEAHPDAPEWAEVRAFLEKLRTEKPPAGVLLQYWREHLTDRPQDLVIRRAIVAGREGLTGLASRPDDAESPQDRAVRRAALAEIVATDPDRSMRLNATMGLVRICQVPDPEMADYLESLAQVEPDIRNLRPFMEWMAYRLRTGDDDPRNMPPPHP